MRKESGSVQLTDFVAQVYGSDEADRMVKEKSFGNFSFDSAISDLMGRVQGAELVFEGRGSHNYKHFIYYVCPEGVAIEFKEVLNLRTNYHGPNNESINSVEGRVKNAFKQPGAIGPWVM